MYPDWQGNLVVALGIGNLIWLAGLTLLVLKNRSVLKRLFSGHQGNFQTKLEAVLGEIKGLEEFKKQSLSYVQKMALKRYNPYQDTGGDQSFSVALLDGKGDGTVITSLHSRTATRVFAKPVVAGKESRVSFSEEEKEVVKEALN